MMGSDLLRAAKIRNIIAQIKKTDTSVNVFIEKFKYLPGDIPNASSLGMVDKNSNCVDANNDRMPDFADISVPQDLGCGGNGNGILEDALSGSDIIHFAWELRNFWYHLSVKQMIDGNFDGTNEVGKGFPETSLPGIGIHVMHDSISENTTLGRNFYVVGAIDGDPEKDKWMETFEDSLKPQDAYNIDFKIDDAMPYSGSVEARSGANSELKGTKTNNKGDAACVEESARKAVYNVTYKPPACHVRIRMGR